MANRVNRRSIPENDYGFYTVGETNAEKRALPDTSIRISCLN